MNTKTENTKIETVSLPNTTLTFKFVKAGVEKSYRLSDLPEASLLALLQYGTRKGNDFCNSAFSEEGNTKTRQEIVEDWLGRLETGDFNPKRDSVETGFKKYLQGVCKKLAITPEKAWKGQGVAGLLDTIASVKGCSVETVEPVLRANYEKVKALFDLDLDI